ncbi:MAG: flap endonuclease-1 [Candidatus Brocadia sp.]
MGVKLTPIVLKKEIHLDDLRRKVLAVDGNAELYQFLALIRKPDGTLLTDSHGHITSHLIGLTYRSTRLISEYGIKLIFVFDGKPPSLKKEEIERRHETREKFVKEYEEAKAAGDMETAFAKSVMTSRLTQPMLEDAMHLLELLGIPYVQAPGEGEAQAAFMARRGDAWGVGSKDYDSLLFGTPRLVRFVTISGKEFLPSKGKFRPLKPEIIETREMLSHYQISLEQLIDLAILIGTDFNHGVKGIGPKTALRLVQEYGRIERLPPDVKSRVSKNYEDVREIFYHPPTTEDYMVEYGTLDEDGLYEFLCKERDFSRERVEMVIRRMKTISEFL